MGRVDRDKTVLRDPGPLFGRWIVHPDDDFVFFQVMGNGVQQMGQIPTRPGAGSLDASSIDADNHAKYRLTSNKIPSQVTRLSRPTFWPPRKAEANSPKRSSSWKIRSRPKCG